MNNKNEPIYTAAIFGTVAETATLGNQSVASVMSRIILIGCRS